MIRLKIFLSIVTAKVSEALLCTMYCACAEPIFVNTRLFSVIFAACHTVYLSSANKEMYKKQILVSENLYFQIIEIGKVHCK